MTRNQAECCCSYVEAESEILSFTVNQCSESCSSVLLGTALKKTDQTTSVSASKYIFYAFLIGSLKCM